jgi:hypothetical protein
MAGMLGRFDGESQWGEWLMEGRFFVTKDSRAREIGKINDFTTL